MTTPSGSAEASGARSVHPLRVRDFRLLWIGESISLLGDQFYLIALPWLVLQVTGNALALGTVLALASIPRALFMIIGGALVDRFSPRLVMLLSNFVRMVLVGVLALLVITDNIQLWMLYVFGLAFGTADAFYFPAQTAIVPQLLDDDQLQMGNTLTQGMSMLSMFVGPVLAGLLIGTLAGTPAGAEDGTPGLEGIGIAFALDALSFLGSVIALWLMRVRRSAQTAAEEDGVLAAVKEGMAYVWDSAVLRTVFLLLVGINLFVIGPFDVGVPVLADRNLAEGATAFGILMSAYGAGALLGIVLSGVLPRPRPSQFGPVLLGVIALLGIALVLLPLSTSTPVVALLSLFMGTTMGYVNVSFMTWIQKRIPDALMGRVMSLLMFASVGIAPVSSTLAGILLNADVTVLFVGAGVLMTAVTLLAVRNPSVRRRGLDVGEVGELTVADAIRATGEYSIRATGTIRTTSSMRVVRP